MSEQESKAVSEETSEPSAVLERLSWQWASRDDVQVAQALYAGEEVEELHESLVKPDCSTSVLCSSRRLG